MQTAIRCVFMRGGTPRGPFFKASDLPVWDKVLLALMGPPRRRQIHGLDGAHPLTSRPDVDLDLFAQLQPETDIVTRGIAAMQDDTVKTIAAEHPIGEVSVELELDTTYPQMAARAAALRTAPALIRGETMIPASVWSPPR